MLEKWWKYRKTEFRLQYWSSSVYWQPIWKYQGSGSVIKNQINTKIRQQDESFNAKNMRLSHSWVILSNFFYGKTEDGISIVLLFIHITILQSSSLHFLYIFIYERFIFSHFYLMKKVRYVRYIDTSFTTYSVSMKTCLCRFNKFSGNWHQLVVLRKEKNKQIIWICRKWWSNVANLTYTFWWFCIINHFLFTSPASLKFIHKKILIFFSYLNLLFIYCKFLFSSFIAVRNTVFLVNIVEHPIKLSNKRRRW